MKIPYFILVLLLLLACGKDDEPTVPINSTMQVEKGRVPFTVNQFSNTIISNPQNDAIGYRLDMRSQVDGGSLILTVSFWDWQITEEDAIPIKTFDVNGGADTPNRGCTDINMFTYCDAGLGSYDLNGQFFSSAIVDTTDLGTITISENNPDRQTVSGSFDFFVQDANSADRIRFTGTFSDLKY